jgi:hypothetical protein
MRDDAADLLIRLPSLLTGSRRFPTCCVSGETGEGSGDGSVELSCVDPARRCRRANRPEALDLADRLAPLVSDPPAVVTVDLREVDYIGGEE